MPFMEGSFPRPPILDMVRLAASIPVIYRMEPGGAFLAGCVRQKRKGWGAWLTDPSVRSNPWKSLLGLSSDCWPEATARILLKSRSQEVKMRQRTLGFEEEQDPRWQELPPRTQRKIQNLVGQLIQQAWRKEAEDERKDQR